MKWISTWTWKARKQYKENWHVWFAWYPVTVQEYPDGGAKRIWLEPVLRKGCHSCWGADCSWDYYYKEIVRK